MNTILENALEHEHLRGRKKSKNSHLAKNPEVQELVLAWLSNEIGVGAMNKALKCKNGAAPYALIAIVVRKLYKDGVLIIASQHRADLVV